MTRTIVVYVSVAAVSFILSNVWMMQQNNSFEAELMGQYESMISSLQEEFAGQKKLISSINREEIEWYQVHCISLSRVFTLILLSAIHL